MIPFFRKMLLFVTLLGCQNNTTNSENWETHGSVESEDKNLFIFIIFLHTGDVRIWFWILIQIQHCQHFRFNNRSYSLDGLARISEYLQVSILIYVNASHDQDRSKSIEIGQLKGFRSQ